jgi:S-adenosylmethionine synthetase
VQIQVAYSIGSLQPVSLLVDTGDSKQNTKLEATLRKEFDFSPGAILDELQLRRPIYTQTSAYGHFGRTDLDLPWEKAKKL